jgi:enoyl-CoA hydratase/carnithine racemase
LNYEQITYETDGDVAVITLNRPDRLNAWTRQMSFELADAVSIANDEQAIGAIVFTGAGRGFCAGADIENQFKAQLDKDASKSSGQGAGQSTDSSAKSSQKRPSEHQPTDWVKLCRASKPMVAAVNGPAIGLGLTLILPMDRIIASDQAKLSCRFVKMGITPELASSRFLVQRCGWGPASDLALSGRIISAAEAAELRLVDEVVPADRLMDAALEKARDYAANPDPQLRMIKQLLTENASETDIDLVQRREGEALAKAYKTPHFAEAVDAFLAKRPAKFR